MPKVIPRLIDDIRDSGKLGMPHWVTKVEHLRCATQFVWHGLDCAITPSQDDLNLNERLKRERARAILPEW
jgi:hypothetical protein